MEKLFLIDASGYLYRSYHAIGNMTNGRGDSTNALFGFIRSIVKLQKDFAPLSHIAAIFDGPRNKERREALYADYKAHREEMPGDLIYQMEWAREFCELAGIPQLTVPGVEADDTMGTIALWAAQQKTKVFLCTGDKDMVQIVDEHIVILNTWKENLIVDAAEVEKIYGIKPSQMVDWLAIVGDASDNVPGLAGFGPKTATQLLQEFGTLDALLAQPERVSAPKKRDTLIQQADIARLSRELVTLHTDVEFPHDPAFFQLKPTDIPRLKQFFAHHNFNTLLRELPEAEIQREAAVEVQYLLVDDEAALEELIKELSTSPEICFDTQADSERPMLAHLCGVSFCTQEGRAWYVPVNGQLGQEKVLQALKPLFENPTISFYGHNTKFDYQLLKNYEITIANLSFDTILASYLLSSHSRQHTLDGLALEYFDKRKINAEELIGKGKTQRLLSEIPCSQISNYCCEEVDYTFRLKQLLAPQLQQRHLDGVMNTIELPLIRVLAHMERTGIYIDVPYLEQLSQQIHKDISKLQMHIFQQVGQEFNLNSPTQLRHILENVLNIHLFRKTAKGATSTSADVLEDLRDAHPIIAEILDYRVLEKLRSNYVGALPAEVNPQTHRIHCNFTQFTAATGRLACQDPNLQNIPIRSQVGRQIRAAFRPNNPLWSLLAADYSQIELRLLAHFSEDPALISAFEAGEDIHTFTASQVFNLPIDQVTSQQRMSAKTVNFGILYGQGAFGLARQLRVPMKEASDFIHAYFNRYPRVLDYLESSKELARKTGRVLTITGRERLIPEIHSKNANLRNAAERLAINTPLQGTAADLIKLAMLQVNDSLHSQPLDANMLLQIHDELLFEVSDGASQPLAHEVKKIMEGVFSLKVPLIADIKIGKNWAEC